MAMSNQNFVLSDQDGVLVGQMSFQEKNNYFQLWAMIFWGSSGAAKVRVLT